MRQQPRTAARCRASMLLAAFAMILLLLAPDAADARRRKKKVKRSPPPIYVSNDATLTIFLPPRPCGAVDFPCRTIQAGIEAAPDGGTVQVGPGLYANTDGKPGLSGRGERNACSFRGCGAVLVERGVRVVSAEGAPRTIVDLTGVPVSAPAVVVADGTFGTPGKGFTVMGTTQGRLAAGVGIHCEKGFVSGNVVIGNLVGMVLEQCSGTSNVAIDNLSDGFVLAAVAADETAPQLSASYALGNGGAGFVVAAEAAVLHSSQAIANAGDGVRLLAGTDGTRVDRGVALANKGSGFRLRDAVSSGVTFSASTATGNGAPTASSGSGEGFHVEGTGSVVSGNTAVGNGHHGVSISNKGQGDHDIVRNQLIGNFTYGIGWANAQDGQVDQNASYANRVCQIHDPGRGLTVASRGYWGGPAGDVPTCRPPTLEPLAASPDHALGKVTKKKKKRKKKSRRRNRRNSKSSGVSTWPIR